MKILITNGINKLSQNIGKYLSKEHKIQYIENPSKKESLNKLNEINFTLLDSSKKTNKIINNSDIIIYQGLLEDNKTPNDLNNHVQKSYNLLSAAIETGITNIRKSDQMPNEYYSKIKKEKFENDDKKFLKALSSHLIGKETVKYLLEEDFEELILETSEEGKIVFKPEWSKSKVFEKIYLDLQEDEIEFSNEGFKELYYAIINEYNQSGSLKIDQFVNSLPSEPAQIATHVLMDEEKHQLHDWERKDIFVKEKKHGVSQIVSETILNLRRHLVAMKIADMSELVKEEGEDHKKRESLQDIMDYISLKKILSEKLNRVL